MSLVKLHLTIAEDKGPVSQFGKKPSRCITQDMFRITTKLNELNSTPFLHASSQHQNTLIGSFR